MYIMTSTAFQVPIVSEVLTLCEKDRQFLSQFILVPLCPCGQPMNNVNR